MATTAKSPKDKPPRLAPRPTAASAARAARIATNRNLIFQQSQRHSPNRVSLGSPTPAKKLLFPRTTQKTDSKPDEKLADNELQSNRPAENEVPTVLTTPAQAKSEADTYIIDNVSNIITEESPAMADHAHSDLDVLNSDTFVSSMDIKTEDLILNETSNNMESKIITPPHTPLYNSRPQTPKSLVSSRPQTPRSSSRPVTPANNQRKLTTTPTSRPNTPQRASPLNRPRTPSALPVPIGGHVQAPSVPASVQSPVKEEVDLKAMFAAKRKQFQLLKKELDLKQQAILEVLDSMRNINNCLALESAECCEEDNLVQGLVMFNVGDWTAEEIAQLCRDAAASSNAIEEAADVLNTIKDIDESSLTELDSKVVKVSSKFADLCLQAFTARQELIDWIKELIGQMQEDGRGESLDRIAHYNAQGFQLCEALRELKSRADDAVDTVTQISRKAYRERSALLAVGESLVREIARLRADLESRTVVVHKIQEILPETDTVKSLEETRRLLEEEQAARVAMKEKLATSESQLRQTRIRVSKMDRQLKEAEASIASLTGTVKSLEEQSRLRDVQFEARARKLKESLKTGEVASSQISQHRDTLQAEVQSLKELIDTMTNQHKAVVQELNKEVKELQASLEMKIQEYHREVELRTSLEKSFMQCEQTIEELKAKNIELEKSRPNPELPTEREMDLWAELQATKDTLRITEDEVTACKREKVRFLETFAKISESENKVGMQQKLAAELLSKEEIIGKMQIQIRELTKNIKLNEQKVIQYEQYVCDLQAHNHAVANCQEAPNGISYQDLQQEIMNLRMQLLDAVHRNEELSEVLAQKEQQLEQQDKTSRAQARVIKVREELINLLKNKETEQSRELSTLQKDLEHRMKIVDEVNKQIAAKAEEIQELFATLENKQQQIHRLEKIVLALEEQQKRAQAQRTRHEEKIAALEHELAAGNRRERKFIFF